MEEENNSSEFEFGKLSKINSAGLVNSQLSNLWLDFFRHYRHGEYLSANSDLDCIWTILGGEKGMAESVEEVEYFTIEGELSKTGILKDNLDVKGFGKIDDKEVQRIIVQKGKLLKKAMFLRRLQNQQGKGTAYSRGNEDDFD